MLYTPHSTLHSKLWTPHSTNYTLHLTLCTLCTLYTPHSRLYTSHSTHHTLHFTLHTLNFTVEKLHYTTFYTPWPSFSCCARTPTSRPQLQLCTALLLATFPKVHSDAEGGPLNLPQSLVIMLAMLIFLILFVQQYIIICSHHSRPHPL